MKKFSLLLILLAFSSCMTVKIPNPRHVIQKQIQFEKLPADLIFDKTEMWMARTFVDSRAVMEVKNREGKMMYNNAIVYIQPKSKYYKFSFTLEIHIKDNTLKCDISNIDMIGVQKSYFKTSNDHLYYEDSKMPMYLKNGFNSHIDDMLVSLEQYVKTEIW